jgi:ubiquinone/menaquinone biosynthesis C-methylase UbiE
MMAVQSKPYKGMAMEGLIATWYAKNTRHDARGYRRCAESVAARVRPGGRVLEVAPGPGYLAIELAKLGDFEITGLDISRSFVRIARENAARAGVQIDFRHGNASAMPFPSNSFDFVVCRAAFKNFADPIGALNEIHRVLVPGGQASVYDLRKDASRAEIDAEIDAMDLSWLDNLLTKATFRVLLLKSAYTRQDFERMAAQSRFGTCEVLVDGIGYDVRLTKQTEIGLS